MCEHKWFDLIFYGNYEYVGIRDNFKADVKNLAVTNINDLI
jgi:uncharacterized protein YegJ (DUF2314 family)